MREDLMVQQQVKTVWQHMVGVICLNQTYRKQVKEVLPKLFEPPSEYDFRVPHLDAVMWAFLIKQDILDKHGNLGPHSK